MLNNNEHTNIIISNPNIKTKECKKNPKHIHYTITSQYLTFRKNNKVTNNTPHDIHSSEQTLPRHMRTNLAQLEPADHHSCKVTNTVNLQTLCHNVHYASHTHMTLITSLTVVKNQQNKTQLVCRKSF